MKPSCYRLGRRGQPRLDFQFVVASPPNKQNPNASGRRRPDRLRNRSQQLPRLSAAHIAEPVASLADRLNEACKDYRVGSLQRIRQRIKGLRHTATSALFTEQSIKSDYAFHLGGRSELQFNIGIDTKVRHGLAFSIEPSQSHPAIVETLKPRIERFNELMRVNPSMFAPFMMWYWRGGVRSEDYKPHEIGNDLMAVGTFIMLGSQQDASAVDIGRILSDFDSLLPIYEFVESDAGEPGEEQPHGFKAGHTPRVLVADVVAPARSVQRELRHAAIQTAMYEYLSEVRGRDNVGTEQVSGFNNRIDLVVKEPSGLVYYELKVAATAVECVREGLGQVLQYGFFPRNPKPTRVVIVGEAVPTDDECVFLHTLRNELRIPVTYEQWDKETGSLKSFPAP